MRMEVRSDGWKICFRTLNSEQLICTSKGIAGSGEWEWYIGRELRTGTGSCFFWIFFGVFYLIILALSFNI